MGTGSLSVAQAQDLCPTGGGGFSINGINGTGPVVGCAPFTVNVSNTVPGALNIKYDFDYKGGDGSTANTVTSFNYTKPGTYRILQVGSSGATGITACRQVIVRSNTPPNIRLEACPGNVVKLTIVRDSVSRQYDQFVIDWRDGPSQTLNQRDSLVLTHQYPTGISGTYVVSVQGKYLSAGGCAGSLPQVKNITLIRSQLAVSVSEVQARSDGSVSLTFTGVPNVDSEVLVKTGAGNYAPIGVRNSQGGTQSLTLPSLDPKQAHCVKIRSTDACGNTIESNAMCTMVVNGIAENERNVLTWNQTIESQGFARYQLLRDGVIIRNTTNIGDISYLDTDVQCGVTYRYQVIAYSSRGRSMSAPIEVTARSDRKPGVVEGAIVSVENNGSVSVVAIPPAQGSSLTYRMVFERSDNPTGGFREIGTTDNLNRYSDITVATSEKSYCYRVSYENACGNRSDPSQPICTVFLQKNGSTIRWTTDLPFTEGMGAYFVIKLNEGGASSETGVGLNATYDPRFDDPNQQRFGYQIRARSQSGAYLSFSNMIDYRREPALFLPNAFSPNGDGQNDVFEARGTFFDNFQMIIYNRWGQSIFQTTTSGQGWDGMVNGERAPEGNYTYRVIILDSTGREFVKTGTLLLLR